LADKSNRIKKLVATFSTVKYNPVNTTIGVLHFNNTFRAELIIQVEASKKRPMVKGCDGRNSPQEIV